MRRFDEEPEPTVGFDPLADLFFSVVAIVVLAIIVILPTLRLQATADARADEKRATEFRIDGHDVNLMRATAAGLTYGPSGQSKVSLDAIDNDASLDAYLRRLRDAGLPLLLFIEPNGDEAAFSLEPVLAREGPAAVTQVRLDSACGHLRGGNATLPCPVTPQEGAAR